MKKLTIILTLLLISSCGVLREECGKDIQMACNLFLGEKYEERIDYNKENIEKVRQQIQQIQLSIRTLEIQGNITESFMLQIESRLNNYEIEVDNSIVQLTQMINDLEDGLIEVENLVGDKSEVELIDPCGTGVGHNEVLLNIDNQFVAVIKVGNKRYLTKIKDGTYRTEDNQECRFNISNGVYTEL